MIEFAGGWKNWEGAEKKGADCRLLWIACATMIEDALEIFEKKVPLNKTK